MEPITLVTLAAKYIMEFIKNSKTLDNTKEQTLTTFIGWVKKKLFKKSPKLETIVIGPMAEDKREEDIKNELMKLLKEDPTILNEFREQVSGVQNIFDATVAEVGGNVHVGDDISDDNSGEALTRKGVNELKGKIVKISGNLHVGNKIKNKG